MSISLELQIPNTIRRHIFSAVCNNIFLVNITQLGKTGIADWCERLAAAVKGEAVHFEERLDGCKNAVLANHFDYVVCKNLIGVHIAEVSGTERIIDFMYQRGHAVICAANTAVCTHRQATGQHFIKAVPNNIIRVPFLHPEPSRLRHPHLRLRGRQRRQLPRSSPAAHPQW